MKQQQSSPSSSLWSIEPGFRLKVFFLGLTFMFLSACQAIWRPLKSSIFAKIVGSSYVPDAKLIVLLYIIPLIIFYSYLVDRLRRHQLVYVFSLFHGVGGLIFYFLLSNPSYGLANTLTSPDRIIGWAFYFFMESFSAFLSTTFWSFADSINKPKDAKETYGFLVSGSKVGGIIAAGTLYCSLEFFAQTGGGSILPNAILAGSFLLLGAAGSIYALMKFVPGYIMHGYEAAYQAEKKRPSSEESLLEKVRNGISGLLVIIKNPYVAGISGLVFIYEIIIVIFDYRVLIFADKTYTSVEALSSYYALYYLCMHGIGLIISLLGTIPLQRLLGLTTSLFICPTVAGILIVGTHFYPTATSLFIALVLLRSFNYALNHPTREALYIPTTKTIKFKAKAWTDAFGSRAAKATGSAFNKASKALVASEALFLSTAASLGLVGIWFAITNYLANRFKKAVENKELIGEEHEASDEEREDLA